MKRAAHHEPLNDLILELMRVMRLNRLIHHLPYICSVRLQVFRQQPPQDCFQCSWVESAPCCQCFTNSSWSRNKSSLSSVMVWETSLAALLCDSQWYFVLFLCNSWQPVTTFSKQQEWRQFYYRRYHYWKNAVKTFSKRIKISMPQACRDATETDERHTSKCAIIKTESYRKDNRTAIVSESIWFNSLFSQTTPSNTRPRWRSQQLQQLLPMMLPKWNLG